MPGPPWSGDPDTAELTANLRALYPQVISHAQSGALPSMDTPLEWHERIHDGVPTPSRAYVGRFRGDNHTDLLDYEVQIGGIAGVRSYLVWGAVDAVIRHLVAELARLDEVGLTQLDRDLKALELAAYVHGEWVRIHPFVNGNGRTARLWVLWICARFGIPPLLRVRPRPDKPYGTACFASMTGDHSQIATLLKQLYAALPSGP